MWKLTASPLFPLHVATSKNQYGTDTTNFNKINNNIITVTTQ